MNVMNVVGVGVDEEEEVDRVTRFENWAGSEGREIGGSESRRLVKQATIVCSSVDGGGERGWNVLDSTRMDEDEVVDGEEGGRD
jgi:hypothetical protein